uniref:Uncharacterized protein n=1 Tax=Anguilla anguilla TaxID=7936 RepID=A0A0E9R7M0_ANGAN
MKPCRRSFFCLYYTRPMAGSRTASVNGIHKRMTMERGRFQGQPQQRERR